MIPRPRPPVEEDDPFDFPDLPDSFSDQNQPSRTPSSSATAAFSTTQARKNLQSTILGQGPNGIGVITKLNTKSKPSTISHGSIKLKNKAVAKTWEDELDFEGDWGGTLKLKGGKAVGMKEEMDGFDAEEEEGWKERLKVKSGNVGKVLGLGLPVKKVMPGPDALDDLDFDMDDDADKTKQKKEFKGTITNTNKFFVRPPAAHLPGPDALDDLDVFDFNEDEATIKAGPALKALLPPPRIRPALEHAKNTKDDLDMDMDDDFALPLNLTNLTLATRSAPSTGSSRARMSIASNNTDWNSPTSQSQSQSDRREGWDSTPPSKRLSETSATSLSDGLNSLAKNTTQESVLPSTPSSQVEEEDMEDGLVMPSKHFFSSKRELNSLLDRKRRPEFASPTRHGGTIRGHPSHGLDELTLNSEGLEDGLVFEDPKAELTRKRLTKSKEARSQIPIPTRRSPNSKPSLGGGGRDSPSKYSIRERTQSTVGLGHRSHSTGNTALLNSGSGAGSGFKPFSPTRPRSPTLLSPSKERSRSGQAFIPLRLPIPAPTPRPKTPPRSSGLRHQKSSSHLQTSPTHSGLSRKQSLSSLQDPPSGSGLPLPAFNSVSSLHSLAEEPTRPGQGYATTSTSRLTNPTSASKAKTRPPLHSVFPMPIAGKISGLPAPSNSGSSATTRSRLLHAQMKRRPYGDGTELEAIEDLEVGEEEKSSWKGSGSGSGRSKGMSLFATRADGRLNTRSTFITICFRLA
jgi:hypothetical protein